MSALSIQVPFPVFQDRDGQPLESGYVWIGAPNLQPQTNPVAVYFDAALTQPAAQPIRTLNGFVSNSGTPAQIYANGVDFSILVQDNKGTMVYNFPEATGISPNAAGVTYTPAGTGAVTTNVQAKLRESVSVKDFGAVGDGVTDDTAAIQAAFDSNQYIHFPSGTYLITGGISKAANGVIVDFGQAVIRNGGATFLFNFGTTSDTPIYYGLEITGGYFEQTNPATTSNLNYIRIAGTKDFLINNVHLKNVSNGGIYIEAGCENGGVDSVTIEGKTEYGVNRGIWLIGATASDWTDQLIDTTSITRNTTPVPVYAVKDVKISGCTVTGVEYGIYFMNTRDCTVTNNYVDISGDGAKRCVALNNYSPGARVTGNTFISDRSSTGVLVTQFSNNVIIADNVFKGSFGGNRDIYVQYLAEALIQGNHFNTTGTQNIEISMGGFAIIKNNQFNKETRTADYRCVYAHPIDSGATGTTGDTATVLPGLVFRDNVIRYRCLGVFVDTNTYASPAGNRPAMGMVDVSNNIFMNMDLAVSASEYPVLISAGTSSNVTRYIYLGNIVLPNTAAGRNYVETSGSAIYSENTETFFGNMYVSVAASGGPITVSRVAGANFSMAVSRSGDDLILIPRTINGATGSSVAIPFGFTDHGGTIHRFAVLRYGNNYILSAYDDTGVKISFAGTAGSFSVLLGAIPNT